MRQVKNMYQALYRKWRPQTFDQVVGQKHITDTLKNQVKTGRLSHAYLFIGTRGTGKTTCARILARAVNCEHPVDGNPCCECEACRGILDGSIMDVVELDAASNNGVDNVRALREEAVFSPSAVRKRVYIVDEVHMLSTAAFNALLKILEEPPEHLMFILATTELGKVPATILSRCQRHSFKRIDVPEIAEYLEYIAGQEHFSLTHEAAALIARLAEGGVRDALSLLDQCSARESIDVEAVYAAMGLAGKRRIAELLEHILRHDTSAAITLFSELWMDGKDPAALLGELSQLLRDLLLLRFAPRGGENLLASGFDRATLDSFDGRMTKEELLAALDTLQSAQAAMRSVNNPRMNAELCLVSLCESTAGESLSQLRARLSRLEEQLERGVSAAIAPAATKMAEIERPTPEQKTLEAPSAPPRPAPVQPQPPSPAEEAGRTGAEDRAPWEEPTSSPQPQSAPQEELVPKPVEPETAADTAPEPTGDFWKAVCKRVSPKLSMELRVYFNSEDMISGRLDGEVLRLEAKPGFAYGRFNRPELLELISQAASAVRGKETRALLSERKGTNEPKRSLDELRVFKEVRFEE